MRGETDSERIRDAADRAVALVEEALTKAGLALTNDARGLAIVPRRGGTTLLVIGG